MFSLSLLAKLSMSELKEIGSVDLCNATWENRANKFVNGSDKTREESDSILLMIFFAEVEE